MGIKNWSNPSRREETEDSQGERD